MGINKNIEKRLNQSTENLNEKFKEIDVKLFDPDGPLRSSSNLSSGTGYIKKPEYKTQTFTNETDYGELWNPRSYPSLNNCPKCDGLHDESVLKRQREEKKKQRDIEKRFIHSNDYSLSYDIIYKYDHAGRTIYSKDLSNGSEQFYEYDKQGNEIFNKTFNPDIKSSARWKKFDNQGRIVYHKLSFFNGDNPEVGEIFEEHAEYDKQGNSIKKNNRGDISHFNSGNKETYYYEKKTGFKRWTMYDQNGNVVHIKDSRGFEVWTEYDSAGRDIRTWTNRGEVEERKRYDSEGHKVFHLFQGEKYNYEYDEAGRLIHSISPDGEQWIEYYPNGNKKKIKDVRGNIIEKYDDRGNVVYQNNIKKGFSVWLSYDGNGNVIYTRNSEGIELWLKYDDRGNELGIVSSDGFGDNLFEYDYDSKGRIIRKKLYIKKNY